MSRVSRTWTGADSAQCHELLAEVHAAEDAGREVPRLRLRLDRLNGRYVRHLRASYGISRRALLMRSF